MIDEINLDSIVRGRVEPYIYAFETNTVPNFLKVGDTYRPVEVRLDEWRKIYSDLIKKYEHVATVDDKTYFRDYAVHEFLMRNGFRRIEEKDFKQSGIYYSNEFFKDANEKNVAEAIADIQQSFDEKDNRYTFYDVEDNLPLGDFDFKRDADWKPRENQKAVIKNFDKAVKQGRTNLLMFAVMRFGKSFTSLCCAKAMNSKLIVVVCGKTAVRSEWKENVQRPKILNGFEFVDARKMLENKNIVSKTIARGKTCVVFLTMQDLLGEEIKLKHKDLFTLNKQNKIDLLIIDETHFGARAEQFSKALGTGGVESSSHYKVSKAEAKGYDDSVDSLEDCIKVFSPRVKLHLSGTPYRILLDNEFETEDIVGTVQYSDIIDAKEKWDTDNLDKDGKEEWDNPYYGFPQMIRFAFNLNKSSIAKLAELKNSGYAYDLSELFSPMSTSKGSDGFDEFKHKNEVVDLLKAIDGTKKDENIFAFLNYDKIKKGSMCRHIVMVLPFCASCDAMEKLLNSQKFHNLSEYEIINIAGFNADKTFNKFDYASRVKEKIENFERVGKKTISLTVGKMLTGSTVKEWDCMIFLRNTSSPQDYDQAIFRLQSPYVKTIKSDGHAGDSTGGKIIKYDMKPQTVLVDFDPLRMYTLQHKKTLIANINNYERGNEVLDAKLKRELEIAPIISMNHSKLQKVEAIDIVDSIRNYNAQKSVMDETFDIEIDERIFEDETLRAIIEKQPEITNKGVKFEVLAHGSTDNLNDNGSDIETPDVDVSEEQDQSYTETNGKGENDKIENNDELKKLTSRLQGFYFKLLLFAFLSENEEKSITDIINHIKTDADCKRIAKNLAIDDSELKLVYKKINPQILNILENKIQNINELGKDITSETISTALKKLSRLSVSEIITPEKLADEMVNSFPEELSAKSKFLDIASKTGEFATALLKKYGKKVKNNIYSIPTSPVTYECTRKIYRCLGLPVGHIYATFTSYDLIDNTKNETILKEIKDMKFDAIVGNPPYQEMDGGGGGSALPIYQLFFECARKATLQFLMIITPSRWFTGGRGLDKFRADMLADKHIRKLTDYPISNECFPNTEIKGGVCYFLWDRVANGDCEITTVRNNNYINTVRPLLEKDCDVFIRWNESVSIYRKVLKHKEESFSTLVSSQKPFGFRTYFTGEKTIRKNSIRIYGNKQIGYVQKEKISLNSDLVSKWKIFISAAYGAGEDFPHQILGKPILGEPETCCTETYLVIGPFKNKKEASNAISYIQTKFFRHMVLLSKATQHAAKKVYQFVPMQDFSKSWTDEELYQKYDLTHSEIEFIDSMIRPMEIGFDE